MVFSGLILSKKIITITYRGLASELAFYMESKPYVFPYNETDIVHSQYDVWGFPKIASGKEAMLITHVDQQIPQALKGKFDHLERVALLKRSIGGSRTIDYHIWRGVGSHEPPPTKD